MKKHECEPGPQPEPNLMICTSCNDFGLISREAFAVLLRANHGQPETVCHCGGIMIVPTVAAVDTQAPMGLISLN